MNNLISISTGLVYKITENWNKRIELLKQFNPEGIELCIAFVDQVLNFCINDQNLRYLNGLKRVSIHAPWEPIVYSLIDQQSEHVLFALEKLNKKLNSVNINFDCFSIKDYGVFQKYDFQTSIENCDWRKPPKTPRDFEPIFNKYKKLKLNLDIAHSLTLDPDPTLEFINLFENRISQIHLSYLNRKLKDHAFIHTQSKKKINKISSYINQIPSSIPIVLECVANNKNEIKLVKQEIKFLKLI